MATTPAIDHAATTMPSDADQYEARVWLAADLLFRDDSPMAGPLRHAPHAVQGTYLRKALKTVAALTDRAGASREGVLAQAAADYAVHRAWAIRQGQMRCYHVTGGQA